MIRLHLECSGLLRACCAVLPTSQCLHATQRLTVSMSCNRAQHAFPSLNFPSLILRIKYKRLVVRCLMVHQARSEPVSIRQHTSAYGLGILIVLQSCSRLHSKDTRGQVLHVKSGMHPKSAAALDALSYPDMSRLSRFRQKTLLIKLITSPVFLVDVLLAAGSIL